MTDPIIDRPTGVFLSYAHADTARLQLFRDHFGPVERGKGFEVWFDRDIAGGEVWNKEIRKAIRDSDIFICLVTTNFLNSNYIRDTELPAIQAAVDNRSALLVPIVLEKCFWQDAFGVVQCVPTTKRGALKPAADWKPQRDGFHEAAKQTKEAIERYLAAMPPPPKNAGPGPSVIATPDGFELADDGPSAAERVDPMQMATHAALKRRLARLIEDMARSCRNSHPELLREVEDYRRFAAVDLADLDLAALASVGTMLDGMARAYRPPQPGGADAKSLKTRGGAGETAPDGNVLMNRAKLLAGTMTEQLEPHVIAGLDALLADHARLMMGFAEGRELVARVAIQKTLIEDAEVTRTAAHGVLEPMAATHGLLATKARSLVEAIDRALLTAGAVSTEVTADAVRSGGRILAGIAKALGRKIDSVPDVITYGTFAAALAGDPNFETFRAALAFLSEQSGALSAFGAAQPELRRLVDWTLEQLRRKGRAEVAEGAGEDIDEDDVRRMILNGMRPPEKWVSRIRVLDLSGEGQFIDLAPLSDLDRLQELYLSATGATDLAPLSGLAKLQRLYLRSAGVKDLAPLVGLAQLRRLDLEGTGVTDLAPLSGLVQLQTLCLRGTGITDLAPLSGLTQLQKLDLDGTGVTDLAPLSGLAHLQRLDLDGTGVADLAPLSGLTKLQRLDLDGTGVTDLAPLSGLVQLQRLDLDRTGVADLAPLSGLVQLHAIDLRGTGVTDLAPLSGLVQLHTLYLRGTGVTDLAPLSGLAQLQWLRLNYTGVTDLAPLAGLAGLRQLDVSSTSTNNWAGLRGMAQLNCLCAADLGTPFLVSALDGLTLYELVLLGTTVTGGPIPHTIKYRIDPDGTIHDPDGKASPRFYHYAELARARTSTPPSP